ncbi:MAG: hypothetical protein ACPH8E_04735 [Flavobacteriales bacterium]
MKRVSLKVNLFNVFAATVLMCSCGPRPSELQLVQDLGVGTAVPHLTTTADGSPTLLCVQSSDTTHRLTHRLWEAGSWGEARTIAEDTAMLVNWADRPQLAFGPDGAAYAHWLRLDERGDFAYTIQAVRSDDGGTSWSEPVSPHKAGQVAEYGFAQWMPFDGGAALAWLDGRDFDENPDPATARMEVRLAQWHASETWSDETVLDSSACTCCPMSTLVHPSGPVELVYRDRLAGEIRDFNRILIEPTSGSFQELGPLHRDGWEIAACPVNGASMSQNAERTLAVWYTAAEDSARVRFAWRKAGAIAFDQPHDLHQNAPLGRVTTATDERGHFYAMWLETNETGGIAWMGQSWDATGTAIYAAPMALIPASESRAGGFPSAVGLDAGVLVAWTNPFPEPHVMTAVWQ